MRYAIYFTPSERDPLSHIAAAWLGRDLYTGKAVPHPNSVTMNKDLIARFTSSPRRYGFHATLKAPFHLSHDQSESGLIAAFEGFAAASKAFTIPQMIVSNIDGFLALVPRDPSKVLDGFAADVVRQFEKFRAPLTDMELARRKPETLGPEELSNLHEWGYPYVFERFRFHMTLTNRIPRTQRETIKEQLQEHFGAALSRPFRMDGLALCIEPERDAPFRILRYASLGLPQTREPK